MRRLKRMFLEKVGVAEENALLMEFQRSGVGLPRR
jgi:hypothetical protein